MIDGQNVQIITELHVTPISLREAQLYIEANHRHCGPPKFHKFSLSLTVPGENEPVGGGGCFHSKGPRFGRR